MSHSVLAPVVSIHLYLEFVFWGTLAHLELRHYGRVHVVNVSVFLE